MGKMNFENVNDSDLLDMLNQVSDEVKRRNNLAGPDFASMRQNTVEQNMKIIRDALGGLGINLKK